MRDIFLDPEQQLSHADPVRRAQIQMKTPLPKRFYKGVSVGETPDGFAILLDGKPVKTPARRSLVVPTRAAAELIAVEWAAQVGVIDPARMPVTRLVNSALDGVANELDAVFDDVVKYAGTDLLCYRADSPERLVARQAKTWDPILAWATETHSARFVIAEGIIHQPQPQTAIDAYAATLQKHKSTLKIAALHTITSLTGSALLALAYAEGLLTAEQAWSAAHVDEDWNTEQWGDDDEAAARRAHRWTDMKAAAALFEAV